MPDYIEIQDLHLRTIIGINPEERVNRQDVLINIRLQCDHSVAGRSDNIDDAVNYRTICKDVITLVENSGYLLVERMAEEIANLCLANPQVERACIKVQKPGALRFAKSVGVEIERSRT